MQELDKMIDESIKEAEEELAGKVTKSEEAWRKADNAFFKENAKYKGHIKHLLDAENGKSDALKRLEKAVSDTEIAAINQEIKHWDDEINLWGSTCEASAKKVGKCGNKLKTAKDTYLNLLR